MTFMPTTVRDTVYLFDLYGVLLDTQSESSLRAIERAIGVLSGSEEATRFWELYWENREALDEKMVTLVEYWTDLGDKLGHPITDIDAVVAADIASWLRPVPEAIDLAVGLAGAGYRVGLLSNIPEFLATEVRASQPWLSLFEHVIMSCDIGIAKPSAAAYRVACDTFGVEPEAVVFFDDNATNIAAAQDCGVTGVLVKNTQTIRQALECRNIQLGSR